MSEYTKEFLVSELHRWVENHSGKIPQRDEMKTDDGYPSSYQYAKIFGTRRWNFILESCGLNPSIRIWEDDELDFLKHNYSILTDEEIGNKLNRTSDAIKNKRHELGLLVASNKQPWQEWEIEYLKNNFYDALQEEIEDKLSHRKWETIRAYATKTLQLRRARFAIDNADIKDINIDTLYIPPRHKKSWTKEDDEYIIENWNKKSEEEIATYLGRTIGAVRKHRQAHLKLYKSMKGNKYGISNNHKINNKKIILLSKDKKHRRCKVCKRWFPNTIDFFYKDRNTLRARCKECDLQEQNIERLLTGSVVQSMKDKMFEKGLSYCSMCNTWKRLDEFTLFSNGRIHSYCDDCRKIEYATRYYGEENTSIYFDRCEKYMDKNGDRCDSIPEQIITNWIIDKCIKYINHPYYKDYVENDNSKRKFDWIIYDNDNNIYFVEYFGMWSKIDKSILESDYTTKAKKKIKDLYKAGLIDKCIFVFPNDLKNKTLDVIFSKYIDLDKEKIA